MRRKRGRGGGRGAEEEEGERERVALWREQQRQRGPAETDGLPRLLRQFNHISQNCILLYFLNTNVYFERESTPGSTARAQGSAAACPCHLLTLELLGQQGRTLCPIARHVLLAGKGWRS